MRKKCAIVGYAPNRVETPFEDEEFDIIGMNDLHMLSTWPTVLHSKLRWDYWFDMHHPQVMKEMSRGKGAHWAWLAKSELPIYTLEAFPEVPSSMAYPLDDVVEHFGSKYFTSTVAYQLAWAAMAEHKEVHIYGVNFIGREEYEYQRACAEYWIGVLRGMGIKVHVPDTSCLLQSGFLYGYETHVINKNVSDNLVDTIRDKVTEIGNSRNNAQRNVIKSEGQLDALNWMSDVFGHVARGGFIPRPSGIAPAAAYKQQKEDRNVEAMANFKRLTGEALNGDPAAMKRLEAAAAVILSLPDQYGVMAQLDGSPPK